MSTSVRRIEYFYTTVQDQPGESYRFLSLLAELGINLLAFNAVPIGPNLTQVMIFPDDAAKLKSEAKKAGLTLSGPNLALMAIGDDEIGVLAGLFEKLYRAGINVYSSNAVTDGAKFSFILFVRPEQYETAAQALGV
jgi:predicted amino acid-binding ACT domain protein